jgi:hypothetical protein
MAKLLKPKAELESLILDQVRANPDWRRIRSIIVIPTLRYAPHNPNWDASALWSMERLCVHQTPST